MEGMVFFFYSMRDRCALVNLWSMCGFKLEGLQPLVSVMYCWPECICLTQYQNIWQRQSDLNSCVIKTAVGLFNEERNC